MSRHHRNPISVTSDVTSVASAPVERYREPAKRRRISADAPYIGITLGEKAPAVMAAERSGDAGHVAERHMHARGQLIGGSDGVLSVETAAGRWIVPKNHAVWVPPWQFHEVHAHSPFAGYSVFIAEHLCVTLPDRPQSLRVSGLLRELVHRAASWEDAAPGDAQTRLAAVLVDELALMPTERQVIPLPQDPRLLHIAKAIVQDVADSRNVEALASWAGIAVRTMTRRFTAETGFTFDSWRRRVRLGRALELLGSGGSVTAVAFEVGYESSSAFIAAFRREFGMTPAQWLPSEAG